VRLLLDEMVSSTVAVQLRRRGHDVVAVQDPALLHLRGLPDCDLLQHAAGARRAVVTDNVPDFFDCDRRRLERADPHHGLLLFGNETFPRHRHEVFVSRVLAVLDRELREHPDDDDTSWVRWLQDA